MLKGRDRAESERFIAMRSHYGFDSFFCQPGLEGAHEKGGVEGEVGRFRRRHLVPVPHVATMAELNELVAAGDAADDRRRIAGRAITVGEHFALEANTLQPLPVEPFDTTLLLTPRVDAKSRVCVRQCFYSVPVRFVGRRVEVRLGAETVDVFDGSRSVASHARLVAKGAESLVLDHYLEVLRIKPGALPGATALARARACGAFSVDHEHYWAAARRRLGDQAGTRALVEVLLAHRSLPADAIRAPCGPASHIGAVDPDVVIVEARRAADGHRAGGRADRRRPGPLRPAGPDDRPLRPTPGGPMTTTDTAAAASIDAAARELRLPAIREHAGRLAAQAQRTKATYLGFLADTLTVECDDRAERRRARRIHEARFPRLKRLADFDLDAAPTINPATIATLASGVYMDAGEPVVLHRRPVGRG